MINATLYNSSDKGYSGFLIKGHAGYANSGKDIICSAVSSVVITIVNSIETFTNDEFECEMEDGFVKFDFRQKPSKEAKLLIDSLWLGLTGLNKEFGDKYIKLHIKEV